MELNNLTVKEASLRTKARPASKVCERDGQRVNHLQLLDTSKINLPREAQLHKALCPCNRRGGEQQRRTGGQDICQ